MSAKKLHRLRRFVSAVFALLSATIVAMLSAMGINNSGSTATVLLLDYIWSLKCPPTIKLLARYETLMQFRNSHSKMRPACQTFHGYWTCWCLVLERRRCRIE